MSPRAFRTPQSRAAYEAMVKKAAAAIGNARGARKGLPEVTNLLEVLPRPLAMALLHDGLAALEASGAADLFVATDALLETCARAEAQAAESPGTQMDGFAAAMQVVREALAPVLARAAEPPAAARTILTRVQ